MTSERELGSLAESRSGEPGIEEFLGEPTRDLSRWRWLWTRDETFPVRSHRGLLGALLVLGKRLLRPFVRIPQNDLWERQRIFNLILLEHVQELQGRTDHEVRQRLGDLEGTLPERITAVMRHNDALFARLDQKVDLYRRQARDLAESLGGALAVVESAAEGGAGGASVEAVSAVSRAAGEVGYLELERQFRGTEAEIGERLRPYLDRLQGRGEVLDLGCGRGESLALLAAQGLPARGVDASASMVAHCQKRGLRAEEGDLFAVLAAIPAASQGAIVSFHVIEHLPAESLDRLVRLSWRALKPGGLLILETPNPLSVVVAARNFWLDPTHRRPIHPESLKLSFRLAGFDPVEQLDLRPFPLGERLPEARLETLPEAVRPLADDVNRLRDRLDDLLFGHQDYALIGEKPG